MIRKLTLMEWFLTHQLLNGGRHHFHNDGILEIDMSRLVEHYGLSVEQLPLTSLLIRACGIWQRECPVINRQFCKTILGARYYSCESCTVNVPVMLNLDGKPYVSVLFLKNPDQKSVDEIRQEMLDYAKSDPRTLPVGRIIIGRKNHIFNRMMLRALHWVLRSYPYMMQKFQMGTVSVSSLLKYDGDQDVTMISRGPGSASYTLCSVDKKSNRIKLGISWDHCVGTGYDAVTSKRVFCAMLQGDNEALFNELVEVDGASTNVSDVSGLSKRSTAT